MDDKRIDELINKALQEDLALPEGLSERLERRIDFLAQEEVSPRVSRRRSFYWISGIAAAILGALFLIFTETNRPAPTMADTFTDPEEAAVVAQNALAFMSRNLNKGLGQVNEAGQEITKINKISLLNQFPCHNLMKYFSLWSKINNPRSISQLFLNRFICKIDRFCLHQHSRSPAVWIIIYLLMFVKCIITNIDRINRKVASCYGTPDDASMHSLFDHFRKKCQNMKIHL